MLEQFVSDGAAIVRLRRGPVGARLDSFCEWALARGYARTTIRNQISFVGSFGRWLPDSRWPVSEISEDVIDEFLGARRRKQTVHKSHRPSLLRFLEFMRWRGEAPEIPKPADVSPTAEVARRFEIYLRTERGLSTATVLNYVPFAQRLLAERFGNGPIQTGELGSSDVSGFVLRHAHSMSPGRAKLMVTAFRSFLTFLFLQGDTRTDLSPCVPTVADWRRSTVPKFISREEVEKVLASCDTGIPSGRRDYVILLMLARLGLRAGEIVALVLEDIDWRAGEVTIRGKGSSRNRLPLLADVGEALADYIHDDRPDVTTRRVFIRARAPHTGFATAAAVTTIVRRAIDRVGLEPATKGAHLLRHSLATEMLRRGASLPEIGEVLRHRSPATTEIYAKVDLTTLRTLAQPWPDGGGPK